MPRRGSLAAIGADGKLLPFDPHAAYTDADEDDDERKRPRSPRRSSLLAPEPRAECSTSGVTSTRIGGEPRPGLGAVDARTGRARPWNPDCDGDVPRDRGRPGRVADLRRRRVRLRRRQVAARPRGRRRETRDGNPLGPEHRRRPSGDRARRAAHGSSTRAASSRPSERHDRTNLAAVDTRTGRRERAGTCPSSARSSRRARRQAAASRLAGDVVRWSALRRERLAAFDRDGSALTGWQRHPCEASSGRCSTAHGTFYVGGRFSVGESRTQRSLAIVDLATGRSRPGGRLVTPGSGRSRRVPTARRCTSVGRSPPSRAKRAAGSPRSASRTARLLPWASGATPSCGRSP